MAKIKRFRCDFRLSVLAIELIALVSRKMAFDNTSVIEMAVRYYAKDVLGERKFREIEKGVNANEELMADQIREDRLHVKEYKV